ncbi:MAG TPA: FAD:protein FMN transferase, partial [Candidatus Dormibacteraeota bacterium]|nr:FAD:protein FMN transferase [Candidatus Dormibacteraeota bacterium]
MSDRPPLAVATWPALGTTATVVTTDPAQLAAARAVVAEAVDQIDRACSRFRPDSELCALRPGAGPVAVSAGLFEAVAVALRAARLTDGLVDPTVGRALRLLGYDRDFAELAARGPAPVVRVGPVAGWRAVGLDPARRTVQLPAGVELDLGATAKALCADRAAAAAHTATAAGVLVSLGGDIATAGPAPPGGWLVQVSDDHARPRPGDPTVAIASGGLATSSTTVRRWR